MPKKLLAEDLETEDDSDVVESISKLDIQPVAVEKAKRTLSAEHKAKMAAGKKLAAERRLLEKSFGKSAMDLKLGVLESNGLLKHEKLQEFEKVYEELTNDKISKSTLKIKQPRASKKNLAPILTDPVPIPIVPIPIVAAPTAPIPIPTPPTTPKAQRKKPVSRKVQFEPEESQSEFDESDNEPVKPRRSIKKQLPSDSEYSTTAELESDSDLDNSYFDMNIFNGFGQEQLPPHRSFNFYR
jgi:hypothetical protein